EDVLRVELRQPALVARRIGREVVRGLVDAAAGVLVVRVLAVASWPATRRPGVGFGRRRRAEQVVLLGALRADHLEGHLHRPGADLLESSLEHVGVVAAQPVAGEGVRNGDNARTVGEADGTYLLEPGAVLDLGDLGPHRLQDVVPDSVLAG